MCQTPPYTRTPSTAHTHGTMFDGGADDDGDQDDALRSALRHAVGTICDYNLPRT